jgi:hypothetical protein
MLYPLIHKKDMIHIVKDKNQCACGLRFNSDIVITRKVLRRIKFIPIGKVSCKECLSKLLNLE